MKKLLMWLFIVIIGLTLVLSLSLGGCKTTAGTTETAAETTVTETEPKELTKVTWISPEGSLENVGDYPLWVAKAMGYFEQFGIELIMEPGSAEALGTCKFVSEKKADVGYPSPGVLSSSVAAGMDVIMAYDLMAGDTFDFAVRKDNDEIKTVQDLAGKTISVADAGWQVIIDPILIGIGIDPKSVTYVAMGAEWGQAVDQGKADAALIWEGMRAQWASIGLDFKYFLGMDYSTQPGNGYVVRKTDLSDPAKVELYTNFFKAASMAAYFTRFNPRASAQIVTDQFPALLEIMTNDLILANMSENNGIINIGPNKLGGYGGFDKEGWNSYLKICYDLGQTPELYTFEDCCTDQLIKNINDFDKAKIEQDAKDFVLNESWSKTKVTGEW